MAEEEQYRMARTHRASRSHASSQEDDAEDTLDLPEQAGGRTAWKGKRNFIPEVAELTSLHRDTSPVLCETFLFDPDPSEAALGSLYIALETVQTSPKAATILESVVTAIRKEYYREPAREMLESLETALEQANHVLAELAEEGETDWGENFHAAVCVFHDTTLHISRSGKASLLLCRKQRLTDIGEGLSDVRTRRPLHAFTSVATGSVTEQDILVLSTPQLFHLVPKERLQQFLIGKAPAQAVSALRSLLEDSREETAFAALILRFVKMPERLPAAEVPRTLPPRANPAPPHLQQRRPSFRPPQPISTERSFLKTVIRFVIQGSGMLWQMLRRRLLPTLRTSAEWSARTGQSMARTASTRMQSAVQEWRSRRGAAQPPALAPETSFGASGTLTRTMGSPLRLVTSLWEKRQSLPAAAGRSFRLMPRSARTFLLLTIVLGILFAGSLYALSKKREEDTAVRMALETLQEARAKKEGADAALIYENIDQARTLVQEARASAEEVRGTKYYTAESTELISTLQATEDRIERITRVSEPNVVGDFASVDPGLKTPAMVAIGSAIYTFNPENNAIYKLTTENGQASVVSQTSQGIGYFRTAQTIPADKAILFSTDSPGLALFDTERGDLLKQEITLPEGVKDIRALGTFGSRLYLLSPEKKMIYGYSKTLAGYEGGSEWLKDASVPSDRAVAMGIDGYIYLLLDDGSVVKMLKGAPVEFKQASLTTPMQHPTRLIVTEELKHLYVLDPQNKRVLVYDTLGALTKQFIFPNAQDVKDIAVKGKEEALYVLDGTKVYEVSLK